MLDPILLGDLFHPEKNYNLLSSIYSQIVPQLLHVSSPIIYGLNVLPSPPSHSFFYFLLEAYKDTTLILLTIVAIISLLVNIFFDNFPSNSSKNISNSIGINNSIHTDINNHNSDNSNLHFSNNPLLRNVSGWIESFGIIIAIFIVVLVNAFMDWKKDAQFKKLSKASNRKQVKTLDKQESIQLVKIEEITVGNVLILEPGDIVSADCLIWKIESQVLVDESVITGESEVVSKCTLDQSRIIRENEIKEGFIGIDNDRDGKNKIEIESNSIGNQNGNQNGDLNQNATENQNGNINPIRKEFSSFNQILNNDPFLISGTAIVSGRCMAIVVAVGPLSYQGRLLLSMKLEQGVIVKTPLQIKLNSLAEKIAWIGASSALIIFIILLISGLIREGGIRNDSGGWNWNILLASLIEAITVVVVAVPEGLPMAVTMALGYATTQMMADGSLVRDLASCETMGVVTTICSDKTGTLTQNKMTVIEKYLLINDLFKEAVIVNSTAFYQEKETKEEDSENSENIENTKIKDSENIENTKIEIEIKSRLIGSGTECALIEACNLDHSFQLNSFRNRFKIVDRKCFSSITKTMSTIIELPNGTFRLYLKGAAEIVLKSLLHSPSLSLDDSNNENQMENENDFNNQMENDFENDFNNEKKSKHKMKPIEFIDKMAKNGLRTICIAYKDSLHLPIDDQEGMILINIVGIEDPLREGVKESIKACHEAGITVRMVTGDNLETAKSIAIKCGIIKGEEEKEGLNGEFKDKRINPNSNSILGCYEGKEFRKNPLLIASQLRVLARSTPLDKQILVETLRGISMEWQSNHQSINNGKEMETREMEMETREMTSRMEEIVAVTGDGSNDGPALRMANVGLAMGKSGTDIAKRAASIILLHDDFPSIVKAVAWGRCIRESICKFLQFQLTVNASALMIVFIISAITGRSALTALQLLWINLIMDPLGALALATGKPRNELMNGRPSSLFLDSSSIISVSMYIQIISQSIYQIIVCLLIYFLLNGQGGIGIGNGNEMGIGIGMDSPSNTTLLFNTFVFMQLFNELNCRTIDEWNIFKTLNFLTIILWILKAILQIIAVTFGGIAFHTKPLSLWQWIFSISISIISIPLGIIVKLIHNLIQTKIEKRRGVAKWQMAIGNISGKLRVFNALRRARDEIQ